MNLLKALAIISAVLAFSGCRFGDPNAINLKETFGPEEVTPLGAKVAYSMIGDAWKEAYISQQKYKLSQAYFGSDSNRLYVNISRNFLADAEDVNILREFVRSGNTALIVTAKADSSLLQMLDCEQKINYPSLFSMLPMGDVGSYYASELADYTGFHDTASFFYRPVRRYLSSLNPEGSRIISYTDEHRPNCMMFFIGQGRLYLHTEPALFSNYFLLRKDNARYLETLLRILPANIDVIYQDDYYWQTNFRSRRDGGSSLSAILASPPLAAAFWIALGLFLLYVLFNSKRRQRIIPVQQQAVNSSVAFVEAMSGLYYGRKDNRVIAVKMISQFHEAVRARFFTSLHPRDEGYAEMLAGKTGAGAEDTQRAAELMRNTLLAYTVSDHELLELNAALEKINQSR